MSTRTVRALTMNYRNPRQRLETRGVINKHDGRLVVSTAGDKVPPGSTFELPEEEYDALMRMGAIEDVEHHDPRELVG